MNLPLTISIFVSFLFLLNLCAGFEFPRISFLQQLKSSLIDRNINLPFVSRSKPQEPIFMPVEKFENQPVLKVMDPKTRSEVFLVGVSHGSPASSQLVEDTILSTKPASVVLELCYDRYMAICVDANLNPYGDNDFLNKLNEVRDKIKNKDLQQQNTALKSDHPLSKLLASARFIYSQGLVGGFFILVGFLGTSSQLLTSSARSEDEFTTAIRVATDNKIPIRLADAPQNETLQSIRSVISKELFDPIGLYYGARDLTFSFLGLLPQYASDKEAVSSIPSSIMAQSKWVNIPKAYSETPQLLKSMAPLLLCTSALLLLETVGGDVTSASASSLGTPDASDILLQDTLTAVFPFLPSFFNELFPPVNADPSAVLSATADGSMTALETILANGLHFLEFSFLVRLSKVIGTRRDAILARNIQTVSNEFQGEKIVVVNGMLHSNGVARWLLSGRTPEVPSLTDSK